MSSGAMAVAPRVGPQLSVPEASVGNSGAQAETTLFTWSDSLVAGGQCGVLAGPGVKGHRAAGLQEGPVTSVLGGP